MKKPKKPKKWVEKRKALSEYLNHESSRKPPPNKEEPANPKDSGSKPTPRV